jgi:hypothetical protein
MKIVRKLITSVLALLMAAPAGVFAENRHLVPPERIAAALSEHVARQNADRRAIRETLTRPQVRELAGRMRVDLTKAIARVDTLADADLARAASVARQVDEQLVGGQNVTITTTTIIIALLVVILIIVAVK